MFKYKILLLIICLISGIDAFAVCFAPISRVNNTTGPKSDEMNGQLNAAYGRANELPGDCILDETITSSLIQNGAITNAHFANNTITASKFAPGVIPLNSRPLRMTAFTSNGTWVKGSDVGSIAVHVVGGGGASRDNFVSGAGLVSGTASAFGSHCTANPGGNATSRTGASGGTATGGHINLTGENGHNASMLQCTFDGEGGSGLYCTLGGKGGSSLLGRFGSGGMFKADYGASGGAGAGGYCYKLIPRGSLADSVAVTVGAGGYATGTNAIYSTPGQPGIVLIYEYAQ